MILTFKTSGGQAVDLTEVKSDEIHRRSCKRFFFRSILALLVHEVRRRLSEIVGPSLDIVKFDF